MHTHTNREFFNIQEKKQISINPTTNWNVVASCFTWLISCTRLVCNTVKSWTWTCNNISYHLKMYILNYPTMVLFLNLFNVSEVLRYITTKYCIVQHRAWIGGLWRGGVTSVAKMCGFLRISAFLTNYIAYFSTPRNCALERLWCLSQASCGNLVLHCLAA